MHKRKQSKLFGLMKCKLKLKLISKQFQDLWFKHPSLQNYNTSQKLMLCVEFLNPLALQ